MSRQIADLELSLAQLIAEHKKLLAGVERQQEAMRKLDVAALELATADQEAARLRIAAIDTRRRFQLGVIAKLLKVDEKTLTLSRLADLHPPRRKELLALRNELKDVVTKISTRAKVANRVASAILGHLNTVVRIVAGAVEKANVYTKQGTPRVSSRIGLMEAVG